MTTQEIECRFLEIDKNALIKKLIALGAHDEGEIMPEEIIIYDSDLKWKTSNKFIRLRKKGEKIKLTYKEHRSQSIDGAYEIEFEIGDMEKAEQLFTQIGFKPFRHQQKKRHTLKLGNVTFDIDTWPKIPTYVEIEGESKEDVKKAAEAVGYDWEKAVFNDAAWVLENKYNIPLKVLKWFTFDRFEY